MSSYPSFDFVKKFVLEDEDDKESLTKINPTDIYFMKCSVSYNHLHLNPLNLKLEAMDLLPLEVLRS